jgi:signal transduction histidine kinase
VNNILAVYHYESGHFLFNFEPGNLQEVLEQAVRPMIPLAIDKNSEISIYIEPNLPETIFDKDEIRRVITNLINNSLKHTKKGTEIKVSAKKSSGEIKISISDNGQGIPPEEHSKIFQRYPSIKRKIGTGLGLYLSKQIIDAHKGKIWFETEQGKGTSFYFTLPLKC